MTGEQMTLEEAIEAVTEAHPTDAAIVRRAIREIGRRQESFTTDDVRTLLPILAQPNTIGAVIKAMHNTGELQRGGVHASDLPSRRGGLVRTWRLSRG